MRRSIVRPPSVYGRGCVFACKKTSMCFSVRASCPDVHVFVRSKYFCVCVKTMDGNCAAGEFAKLRQKSVEGGPSNGDGYEHRSCGGKPSARLGTGRVSCFSGMPNQQRSGQRMTEMTVI